MLQKLNPATAPKKQDGKCLSNYSSDLYQIATFFDPKFRVLWIDTDLQVSDAEKMSVRKQVTETVIKYVEKVNSSQAPSTSQAPGSNSNREDIIIPPNKKTKLFANYQRSTGCQETQSTTPTLLSQISLYLDMPVSEKDLDNSFEFWFNYQSKFPNLYIAALCALQVPAASAAVERVFSQGGLIMQPRRARLSDAMLSNLIFMKCNGFQ